jgi:flavin reductase (DIM6/NTAB) family NADH-FMN oxidoreductase RutF
MKEGTFSDVKRLCGRPERIVWAVAEHGGQRSICPLGWKMQTSHQPPMMAISVAPARFTHDLIANAGAFVLAWPGEDLAEATMFCGTRSGRKVDKFAELSLATRPATRVDAPLIEACIANLECAVAGQMTSGDHTIFAAEVKAVWVHEAPRKPLCSIGHEAGYTFLIEKGGYRFGVVRDDARGNNSAGEEKAS